MAPAPLFSMPRFQFGQTDMWISRVGLGAWAFGGDDWNFSVGPQDDAESIKTIHRCYELGINWIDTAPVYGLGHSETVIGRALKEMPRDARPYVFTKCGCVFDESNRSVAQWLDGRPESIRQEVDGSLRRLGIERIDLYQMHHALGDIQLLQDYWGTLLDLKKAGKVRAVGLSNHDAGRLQVAEQLGHVDSLQMHFSAISREFADKELPLCRENRTGAIVYSSLQSGLLSGRFSLERRASMHSKDVRAGFPDFNGDRLHKNLALVEALQPIAARHGVSVATLAIGWTLSWPGVSGAIVGARNPGQVDEWWEAGNIISLEPEDLDEIEAALAQSMAGEGPRRPPRNTNPLGLKSIVKDVMPVLRGPNTVIASPYGGIIVKKQDAPELTAILADEATTAEAGSIKAALTYLMGQHPDVTCLDIGPGAGIYTMIMAEQLGAQGTVIALEENAEALRLLAGNLALNGVENVVCEQIAVKAEAIRQVAAIDSVNLVRIQADGNEPDILSGGMETINELRPFLVINYANSDIIKIATFLKTVKYDAYACVKAQKLFCIPCEERFMFEDLPKVNL